MLCGTMAGLDLYGSKDKDSALQKVCEEQMDFDADRIVNVGIYELAYDGVISDIKVLDSYEDTSSNLRFSVFDNGEEVYSNDSKTEGKAAGAETAAVTEDLESPGTLHCDVIIVPSLKKLRAGKDDNWNWINFSGEKAWTQGETYIASWKKEHAVTEDTHIYMTKMYLMDGLPYADVYHKKVQWRAVAYDWRYPLLGVTVASWIAAGLAFIYLMKTAGHRKDEDGIVAGKLERIPTDLFLLGGIFAALFFLSLVVEFRYILNRDSWTALVFFMVPCAAAGAWIGLLFCMSLAVA